MSWIDKIKNDLIITTGDGKEYKPNWLNANVSREYNVTSFNFIGVPGTLVKREQPQGRKYTLELHFTGEDNIEVAAAFDLSAADKRAWTLEHPYYGKLIVQPLSLSIDDTKYNDSKIIVPVFETITEDFPKSTIDPQSRIDNEVILLDTIQAEVFANEVEIDASGKTQMDANNNLMHERGKSISDNENGSEYFNKFKEAQSKINSVGGDDLAENTATAKALQAVVLAPALFAVSIKTRTTTIQTQIDGVRETLTDGITVPLKGIYQNIFGSLLNSTCSALANPLDTDYQNRVEILELADSLTTNYDQYLVDMDSLQTTTGGDVDSFIPNAEMQTALNNLIGFTISNLFNIAADAKQERTIFLEDDTNLILFTHRVIGLDEDDENITTILELNELSLNGILELEKGRPMKYLV